MKGKVALITGASRGIGKEIAIELARRGMAVAIHFNSGRREAEATLAEVRDLGGTGHCFTADLSHFASIQPLFQKVEEHFGRLDVLVNNAGMMQNTSIAEVSESEFDAVFDLNVKAVFFCCQQAARRLANGGRIINLGTTVTRMMLADYGTYAASKGAVEQLTRVLARELGPRQITVNTLSPGPTDTELFRRGKTPERIDALAKMASLERIAVPADIAGAAALLCSQEAGWITGLTIFANGGFI
jgi:3-oxoacyl-[acyl-carrier protein] reductase